MEVARDVYVELSGVAGAAFTPSGLLVYVPSSSVQSRRLLTRVDRRGAGAPLSDRQEMFVDPVISPDGSRIAMHFDATILDLRCLPAHVHAADVGRRATNNRPIWTPDGKNILYAYEKGGPWERLLPAGRTGAARSSDLEGARTCKFPREVSRRPEPSDVQEQGTLHSSCRGPAARGGSRAAQPRLRRQGPSKESSRRTGDGSPMWRALPLDRKIVVVPAPRGREMADLERRRLTASLEPLG